VKDCMLLLRTSRERLYAAAAESISSFTLRPMCTVINGSPRLHIVFTAERCTCIAFSRFERSLWPISYPGKNAWWRVSNPVSRYGRNCFETSSRCVGSGEYSSENPCSVTHLIRSGQVCHFADRAITGRDGGVGD